MKTVSRLILSAIFLALTVLLTALAKNLPELVFSFYPGFSRAVLSKISAVTAPLPFALWEALLGLALLWALYSLVRSFVRHRFLRWLAGLALTVCVLSFVFVAVWGLGHFGPGAADRLDLSVRAYTEQELVDAANHYADQASALAAKVPRSADGVCELSGFGALQEQASEGFRSLAAAYPLFAQTPAPVKKLAASKLYSYIGITGLFCPFTDESSVNPDTFGASLPFTMCHEMSHSLGVTAEDDANFCAFLACRANPSEQFQYSGYYSAFLYCYNALSEWDSNAAGELWNRASEQVRADCRAANDFYEVYAGPVQQTALAVNDVYLKAFSEEAGVRSYGEVADLLIALYLSESL